MSLESGQLLMSNSCHPTQQDSVMVPPWTEALHHKCGSSGYQHIPRVSNRWAQDRARGTSHNEAPSRSTPDSCYCCYCVPL